MGNRIAAAVAAALVAGQAHAVTVVDEFVDFDTVTSTNSDEWSSPLSITSPIDWDRQLRSFIDVSGNPQNDPGGSSTRTESTGAGNDDLFISDITVTEQDDEWDAESGITYFNPNGDTVDLTQFGSFVRLEGITATSTFTVFATFISPGNFLPQSGFASATVGPTGGTPVNIDLPFSDFVGTFTTPDFTRISTFDVTFEVDMLGDSNLAMERIVILHDEPMMPIPIPATGLLMIAALGGLAAAGARRRAA